MELPRHYEYSAALAAPAAAVFDYLDDHVQLSSHMTESSLMMGNGKMHIEVDASDGRRLGSEIRLRGRILGAELSVTERVIARHPPFSKTWQTTGSPHLLIVGHYRMGFRITKQPGTSLLTVFIDYALPQSAPGRWLGWLLADFYARWCTREMVEGAQRRFAVGATVPQATV
jgi:hypothetical protein